MKPFKVFRFGVLLMACTLCMSCEDEHDGPANGYPGPGSEKENPLKILDQGDACKLSEQSGSDKSCLEDHSKLNTVGCGYNDVWDFCAATWAANPAKTVELFANENPNCEFVFPSESATYYFSGPTYLSPLNLPITCTEQQYRTSFTGRYRLVYTTEEGQFYAYPYQGKFSNELRTVEINVLNRSSVALSENFKNEFETNVSGIIEEFGQEVWNYYNKETGLFTSFPVNTFPIVYYKEDPAIQNGKPIARNRYECSERATKIEECTLYDDGPSYKQGYITSKNTDGVTRTNIYVNVVILDIASIYRVGSGSYQDLGLVQGDNPVLGEIDKNVGINKDGMTIYLYAKSGLNSTAAAHEVGHALLTHHYAVDMDGTTQDGKNLMVYLYSAARKDAPVINPYLSQPLTVDVKYGQAFVVVNHMLLWPTAEGENSNNDGLLRGTGVVNE